MILSVTLGYKYHSRKFTNQDHQEHDSLSVINISSITLFLTIVPTTRTNDSKKRTKNKEHIQLRCKIPFISEIYMWSRPINPIFVQNTSMLVHGVGDWKETWFQVARPWYAVHSNKKETWYIIEISSSLHLFLMTIVLCY